jgi:23S rRNA (cytidine1920-2'-O)/16S rRNA (cytidine1409-2'-O)-methyltransferase
MKFRLDELLVKNGLVKTRSQAQLLIKDGKVLVSAKIATKPNQSVSESAKIKITSDETYVGRGAYKIKAAIEAFKVDLKDKVVADIGASTGGFTDYVLQNGAMKVYCVDVGHGQLAEKLLNDERVINMEGINIRELAALPEKVDLAVADLSYISLQLTLENIFNLVKPKGAVICLIKPQFEAGKGVVSKDGVIKDEELRNQILKKFLAWCEENKYIPKAVIKSPVIGKEGNIEFLVHFQK